MLRENAGITSYGQVSFDAPMRNIKTITTKISWIMTYLKIRPSVAHGWFITNSNLD